MNIHLGSIVHYVQTDPKNTNHIVAQVVKITSDTVVDLILLYDGSKLIPVGQSLVQGIKRDLSWGLGTWHRPEDGCQGHRVCPF